MQEQSKKFVLPSGATLAVTMAPFADALRLTKSVLKSVQGIDFTGADMAKDFSSVYQAAVMIPALLNKMIALTTSDDVEAATFQCAKRALYIPAGSLDGFPGIPVNRELFDEPVHGAAAREDYAQILWGIAEVNCKPFLAKALSGLMGASPKNTNTPSSETVSTKP